MAFILMYLYSQSDNIFSSFSYSLSIFAQTIPGLGTPTSLFWRTRFHELPKTRNKETTYESTSLSLLTKYISKLN